MSITMIAILAIGAIAVMAAIGIYNKLVSLRERTRTGFSQIDVQLERRYDLIPNLVETAKAYMAHERETLEEVMVARASATQARIEVGGDPTNLEAMKHLNTAEGALTGALGRLMAVSENYPDLKADGVMMQLTEELTSTENKVAFARQAYNDSVNGYQTYKTTFPPVFVANLTGFKDAEYLEAAEEKREAVRVQF